MMKKPTIEKNKNQDNVYHVMFLVEREIRSRLNYQINKSSRVSPRRRYSHRDIDDSLVFKKVIAFYKVKLNSSSNYIQIRGSRKQISKELLRESFKQYILKTLQHIPIKYFEEASFVNIRECDMDTLEKEAVNIIDSYIENYSDAIRWDMMISDVGYALEIKTKVDRDKRLKGLRGGNKTIINHRGSGDIIGFNRGYQNMHNYDDTKDYVIYPLLYGTSRNHIQNESGDIIGYGTERGSLSYGECDVKVEKSNKLGGKTNKSLLVKVLDGIFGYEESNRKVSLETLNDLDEHAFGQKLKYLYTTANENEMLLYIHGYNNSFEDAATRAAQVAYDLKFPGVTSFYSWASKNTFLGYGADEATSEISVKYLYEYILNIWQHSSTKKIHILSHSMGNRIFMNVLRKIKEENSDIKFGHIILVAPDIDKELFEDHSYLYRNYSEMSTLYVSSEDKAVRKSYQIHQGNRVGLSPPVVVQKGIDTINADSVIDRALWDLGHSYYAEAEALISDIHELLTSSVEADKRQKLQKVEVLDQKYWQLNII